MMMTAFIFVFTLCVTLFEPFVTANNACVPPPVLKQPPKPLLDKSYSTQIIGKRLNEFTSSLIHEYYDSDLKRYAAAVIDGESFYEMFDYKTGMLHYVGENRGCTTGLNDWLISDIPIQRSLEMQFALGNEWSNEGTKSIRGVTCNVWISCITHPHFGNYSASYYFTESRGHPFRLDIQGFQYPSDPSDPPQPFRSIFDYFMYQEGKPPASAFEPPVGIVCNISAVKTPELPNAANYKVETIEPGSKKVSFIDVFYDKELQILKEIDADGVETVRDFNRAVQFTIRRRDSYCERQTFFTPGRLLENNYYPSDDIQHMASLQHYFLDDGEFTYNGEHIARGIPVDVYSRRGRSGEHLGDSIIQVFLSKDGAKWNNIPIAKGRVIRVLIKSGNPLVVKKQMEIVDFITLSYSRGRFIPELSLCYEESSMQRFQLTFKGPTSHFNRYISWNWGFQTGAEVSRVLGNLLEITPLRVQVDETAIILDNNTIVFEGRLYEKERAHKTFRTMVDTAIDISGWSEDQYFDYFREDNTPVICAEYCTKEMKRPFTWNKNCISFEFNRMTQRCTFFAAYTRNRQYYDGETDFYLGSDYKYPDGDSLNSAWINLQSKVKEGKLSFQQSDTTFTASDVKDNSLDPEEDIPEDRDNPIHAYNTRLDTVMTGNPIETFTDITIGACARQCLNNMKYNCEAFIYNDALRKCDMYDDNRTRNKKDSQVYIRRYDKDFHIVAGKTILSPTSDTIFTNVMGTEACAKLCLNHEDFFCESFELCDTTCVLGRNHYYDVPTADVKTDFTCTHFSRNYIQDYLKYPHRNTLRQTSKVIVQNIGLIQCATQCSTSTSYDCNVFQFCATSSLCYLTTKGETGPSDLDYTITGDCDVYKRKKGVNKLTERDNSASAQSSGHSPGDMGGLAFGMIILGIIVVVIASLVIIKYRSSPHPDGMTIGFSKSRLAEEADA